MKRTSGFLKGAVPRKTAPQKTWTGFLKKKFETKTSREVLASVGRSKPVFFKSKKNQKSLFQRTPQETEPLPIADLPVIPALEPELSTAVAVIAQNESAPPPQIIEKEVVRVVHVPVPAESQHLTTQDLIRPKDALKDAIEAFLLDQRSPHTRRAYAKDLKRFVQYLLTRGIQRGIEKIDRGLLVAYKESLLGEALSHTTIDRHLASLRSFFSWLAADGLIDKNPAEAVRFLNSKKLSPTIGFTDEEVKKILLQPNLHTRVGAQHYAILMVLFYCGLRRSEVCDLKMSSLFIERGIPVFRLMGKGNKERIVPLVKPAHKAILHYFRITGRDRAFQPSEPLFVGFRKRVVPGVSENAIRPLDPSSIFYIVTKYAKDAGIQSKVSPHSCRATAISNARDHQVPDRAIQEFAGWASPDMITRYDKRKSAIEKSAAHSIEYGSLDRLLDVPMAPDLEPTEPEPSL